MRSHLLDLLPHVRLQIAESEKVRGSDDGRSLLASEVLQEVFTRKREHATIRVLNDHRLLRPQQMMRDEHRAQDIFGHDPASMTKDMRVTGP